MILIKAVQPFFLKTKSSGYTFHKDKYSTKHRKDRLDSFDVILPKWIRNYKISIIRLLILVS